MRVFMYWNLHKQCWSLKALSGPCRGRVVGHANSVELRQCHFKVSEAGRQRVLREKRKNVHAGVVGELVATDAPVSLDGVPVTYNPYRVGHFESADLLRTPMTEAPRVVANGRRVVACH